MMRKRTILESETFNQIISYKSVIGEKDNEQRNKIKMDMLNSVINCIGIEKWQRMKPDTKHALEYLTFLSIERGFVWCSPEYVSERYTINSITVRRYVSFLEKQGVVSRLWRSSVKHNGRGCMVVFFHVHPYFSRFWEKRFFLSDDVKANDRADSAKNTQSINENDSFSDSTISIPDLKSKELKDRSENDISLVPDYINHEFASLYKCYFGMDIKKINELWCIVKRQAWRVNIEPDHIADGAIHALKQAAGQTKIKPIKNFVAYFTSTIKNIYHEIFAEELESMGADLSQSIVFEIPYD